MDVFFREAWFCALLAFALNTAAYQAEILRGAIRSVPLGQWEGAASLGISKFGTFWKIILPQALIVALRPYGNEVILMIKGSAIVALISVYDLMGYTKLAYSRTFDFQTYLWTAIIYLVLVEITAAYMGLDGAPHYASPHSLIANPPKENRTMLKIWGRTNSTNVKKALWAAEEVGVPYENIPAGGAFGIVSDPEYRAMNPNGLVPTLEDKDLVLWESNTIVRYLVAQYGDSRRSTSKMPLQEQSGKVDGLGDVHARQPLPRRLLECVRLTPENAIMRPRKKGFRTAAGCSRSLMPPLPSSPTCLVKIRRGRHSPLAALPMPGWKCLSSGRIIPHLVTWYERLESAPGISEGSDDPAHLSGILLVFWLQAPHP